MLVVDRLCVDVGRTRVVDHLSLEIAAGQRVGLLGASGSGKSLTASAIIGHLPPGVVSTGSITVNGYGVAGVPTPRRNPAARPAMVFQSSATALNPMVRVGAQLREPARRTMSDITALLEQVGFGEPERILASYPLELSGGQRQRVCIALALACRSPLLVADEPTTALDVVTQARVLDALKAVNSALLFITHDVAVAAQLCDRLIVMERGCIVEEGVTGDIVDRPKTSLMQALIARAHATDPLRALRESAGR
ncbi:ABC transporter ATP-binding protein [Rhodococcus opacus]|uniref:ABC transporter ATP-binding protein n=1 Tax=Rhodococcus opacus TaxID=37919 RepID=UPI002953D554|nr:ABC transporter ATP-binding protein [Rhodococcus opacus]MDV7090230.1 ABC transporter ATP-binding protein [Rhodococcus opacus]